MKYVVAVIGLVAVVLWVRYEIQNALMDDGEQWRGKDDA